MSFFSGGPKFDVRQFVDEIDNLPDIELQGLFSSEKRQIYFDICDRSPGAAFDLILDQTIEWAKMFETRVRACSSVIGHVNQTHDLRADPHLSGVPILVETEKGLYVYKPRPVDLDYSYNVLVEVLVGYGLKFAPGVLAVYRMPDYGFVEFVNSRPNPISLGERDFTRIGTTLAIVYALAGADCHYENIIFSDDSVFLIDLEGLLQPTLTKKKPLESGSISVLNTGILPARTNAGHGFDFDPSVLGSKKFAFSCSQEVAMRAFLEGFSDGYDCIRANRHKLIEEHAYNAMAESRSRFIACNTVDYYRAMARHVVSLTCTDLSLESSFLRHMKSTEGSGDPFLDYEKEALSRFCIPIFYHSNKDSCILAENGKPVSATLDRSGFESSVTRITSSMCKEDMRRQEWFIKASFELHALNSGLEMDVSNDYDWSDQERIPSLGLVTDLLTRTFEYLKVNDAGQRFAVVPVFEDNHWRLRSRLLDNQTGEVYSALGRLVGNIDTYLRDGDFGLRDVCESLIHSTIEGIYLSAPIELEISGLRKCEKSRCSDALLVSIEEGPCYSILKAFSEQGAPDRSLCLGFISSLELARKRGKVRYGGVFSADCLYVSFGLPLLITALCASLLTLYCSGNQKWT